MKIRTAREELVAEMVSEMGISPYAARRLIDSVKINNPYDPRIPWRFWKRHQKTDVVG